MAEKKTGTKPPNQKQINEWKRKAERWDALEKEISKFYLDENGDELPEDEGGDLCDIGEAAATAFGYL